MEDISDLKFSEETVDAAGGAKVAEVEVLPGTASEEGSRDAGLPPKGARWGLAIVLMVLALAYDVSPVDVIPDAILGVGQADDAVVFLMAAVNLFIQSRRKFRQVKGKIAGKS